MSQGVQDSHIRGVHMRACTWRARARGIGASPVLRTFALNLTQPTYGPAPRGCRSGLRSFCVRVRVPYSRCARALGTV